MNRLIEDEGNVQTSPLINDGRDAQTGLTVLLLVYAAVTLHMTAIWALGGLEAVPFVSFGMCQYVPGLLTVVLVPQWRGRLGQLLRGKTQPRWVIGGYLLTVGTLSLCVLTPSLVGYQSRPFDDEICLLYRLKSFVPEALRTTKGLVPFLLLALPAPALHMLNALGEEVFWRGYLLDWLEARLPVRRAWVANGMLWGLWHAPMILLVNWDFPDHPGLGVVAITVSQVFWSVVLCHLTRRTNSLWTAIVMHATANALTIGLYDLLVDHHYNVWFSPWGILGGAVMAVGAVPLLRNPHLGLSQRATT
jgi:membrane protease YdiL (CAAX protease family)